MGCSPCGSTGVCRACKGSGRSGYFLRRPPDTAPPCPTCTGTGQCPRCHGTGTYEPPLFYPYINVGTVCSHPTSVAMAAVAGVALTTIRIPASIASLPYDQQLTWVSQTVRQHYQDRDGQLVLFGQIKAYYWAYAEGQTLTLDGEGAIVPETVSG